MPADETTTGASRDERLSQQQVHSTLTRLVRHILPHTAFAARIWRQQAHTSYLFLFAEESEAHALGTRLGAVTVPDAREWASRSEAILERSGYMEIAAALPTRRKSAKSGEIEG